MRHEVKRDLTAAIAISLMFAGALILPASWLGFALIGIGALSMALLMLTILREKS